MENEEPSGKEIYGKMAKLCNKSEQCTPDIRKKIKELGGNSILAEEIIGQLEKENFLNDDRFIRSYVNEKFRINRWGKVKIHYYLKMKGLPEASIGNGLDEIDPVEYVQLLVKTMKEKAKTVKCIGKYEKMGQIIRFTQGRGFEPELIHRYLQSVIS